MALHRVQYHNTARLIALRRGPTRLCYWTVMRDTIRPGPGGGAGSQHPVARPPLTRSAMHVHFFSRCQRFYEFNQTVLEVSRIAVTINRMNAPAIATVASNGYALPATS